MAKERKAKVSVKGYPIDLMSWFKLLKRREEWIEGGNPNIDLRDPVAELARELHPGPFRCTLTEVKDETPTSRTYTFRPLPGNILPFFYAGQYVSVKFRINGAWVTRPFAIASSPRQASDEGFIQLGLKQKPGGYVSTWVWENWKAGAEVLMDGAFGFNYYSAIRDGAHVVALAGGSGITGIRSILLDMPVTHRPARLTLLYGSRNEDDVMYYDELNALAAQREDVEVIHVMSEPKEGWTGETGFITAGLISRLVPDWAECSYFVAGPQPMYDFMKKQFAAMGISPTRIRMDAYGETGDVSRHPAYPGDAAKAYSVTVCFGQEERIISALASDTVLVSLEKAGLAPDSQCRSGECGWCRSLLESGDIWQRPESDGVRAKDREDGYFHPCSAYPLSDLRVRVFTRL